MTTFKRKDEDRLAAALRANLRRRKGVDERGSPDAEDGVTKAVSDLGKNYLQATMKEQRSCP